MPTVLRIGRYRFHFYSNEGQEPPHIHVKAGSDQAKFWLEPVALAANYGFRGHELNEIEDLVAELVSEVGQRQLNRVVQGGSLSGSRLYDLNLAEMLADEWDAGYDAGRASLDEFMLDDEEEPADAA